MENDLNNKKIIEERTETTTVTNNVHDSNLPVTSHTESHENISGGHLDRYETTEVLPANSLPVNDSTTVKKTTVFADESVCPQAPPMPPSDFYMTGKTYSWPEESLPMVGLTSTRTVEMLPIEVIEKPTVIHENIRREQIEEIQPVVHVEREKTEIRQITQPLTDKEIMPVLIEERTLPIEVLPTLTRDTGVVPESLETSTRTFEPTTRQVIEKAPIVQENERWRIIEEVTPIIYKETIIPHIIRTSRPFQEVVVEAPVFTAVTMPNRELNALERERYSRFFKPIDIIEAPVVTREIPVAPVVLPLVKPLHKKEIIEETTTTTTSTTVAPTVDAAVGRNSSRSMPSTSSGATILKESHKDSIGPLGEKIHIDSVTTTVPTTRAI